MKKKNKKQAPRKQRQDKVLELSAVQKPIVHARIHPEVFRMLSNYCDYHKKTKQDVIASALEMFFRREKNN